MRYIFSNEEAVYGDSGYILFLVTCDPEEITKEIVEKNVNIDYYLEHKFCNEIVVEIYRSEFIKKHLCGSRFENVKWYGGGFEAEDIMYALSRIRPQLKPKIIITSNPN